MQSIYNYTADQCNFAALNGVFAWEYLASEPLRVPTISYGTNSIQTQYACMDMFLYTLDR
jgi:hypothetical protein